MMLNLLTLVGAFFKSLHAVLACRHGRLCAKGTAVSSNPCAQHPDLVEKRRKAFGDNLRTYLVAAKAGKGPDDGSPLHGVNGVIKEDEPGPEGDSGADDQQADGYNLRRRGTAPA